MSRSTLAAEFNTFVAGLITEATPLTFPANASLDEDNFILNRNGSRQRRLGMDFETTARVSTTISIPTNKEPAISFYRWENAGGMPNQSLLVVQVGNELKFFDQNYMPLTSSIVYSYKFEDIPVDIKFSYASVDGSLVIATGLPTISIVRFNPTNKNVSISGTRLRIRDLFGVEDIVGGTNLRDGNGVATRPTTLTSAHAYNLRNQSWGPPRLPWLTENLVDPIVEFHTAAGKYPSNSDVVTSSLYADPSDAEDRLAERFSAKDMLSNPAGTFPAASGHFIIDALARGTSRVQAYTQLMSENDILTFDISVLPVDTTAGGASVVTEYAGRVWYAGFSGDVTGGDSHSPKLSSYILFSQLVEDPTDITKCYQDGDPTAKDNPDLIDTDGGFIRIDGAYGIVGLVNVGSALMAVAANGVWMIQGGSDYGFKATNYLVTKITARGCSSPESLVIVDNTFMYWSNDGIYTIAPNQYGDYEATNITSKTIQRLYDGIAATDKNRAQGVYDTYEQKVRWIYNNRFGSTGKVRELVLDLGLGAFYTNSIGQISGDYPLVVGGFTIPYTRTAEVDEEVLVDADPVVITSDPVYIKEDAVTPNAREVMFLTISRGSPTIQYAFSSYKDATFTDWKSVDGVGVDAKAYLLTGWNSGGEFQRNKQVPYVTFHFNKTEDGFEEDSEGDWSPTKQSSCKVSSRWDWSNHINSGQWGRSFQAYRFTRHYIPSDISDEFNNGYQTVVTRNRLRGGGKVLSLFIETEPAKDCQLLGWSMVMNVNGNV